MKKFTTLVLVLVLTLSTLVSVVPFGAFAETTATEITENLTGYGGGIRRKSDASILFSPFINELKTVLAGGVVLSDLTIEMTFTLLDGNKGAEVYTFETVSAAINTSNGSYYDIYLNGAKGNCGFCPTVDAYYNVYVEIFNGSDKLLYGTYPSLKAASDITVDKYGNPNAFYVPTEIPSGEEPDVPVEPDEPVVTYPITIEDTGTRYLGFRYKSSSNGDIVFCPTLQTQDPIAGTTIGDVVNKKRSNYVAEITVYHQVGGKDCSEEETVYLTKFETNLEANSNGGAAYTDICIVSATDTNGFCPVDGQYYTLILNIYDTNGTLLYKDGTYKNVTGSNESKYNITTSPYYYETTDVFYAGAQTGDSSIRFVGGVTNAAVDAFDKVDLQVSFTGDGVARTFTAPTSTVYTTLKGTKNGQVFNAVTVKGSGVEAEETVDAAYLFGYAVTGIPAGTYTVTVTPVAYVGETAIKGKPYTYTTVTVENGVVTLA